MHICVMYMMVMFKLNDNEPVFISGEYLVEIVHVSFLGCHQLLQHLRSPERQTQNVEKKEC